MYVELETMSRVGDGMETRILLKKGQILINEGDESCDMYILKSGLLKVYKKMSNQNENFTIRMIKPNEIFGELAFLDGKPRSASIVASLDSEVSKLDYTVFRAMLDKQPPWVKMVLMSLVGKVRDLSEI